MEQRESRLHYIWKHRLYPPQQLATADGESVTVLDPGVHNSHAGPDFFNARLLIGSREWSGNVEIHLRASDWYRHGHHTDPAYDSVILHVVETADGDVAGPSGRTVPCAVLPVSALIDSVTRTLAAGAANGLPCLNRPDPLPRLYVTEWLTALAYRRLDAKATRIGSVLTRFGGDWEQTAFVTLARAMGFGLNSDPMERLAASIPVNCLGRHSDDIEILEALLLGQGGLLGDDTPGDGYMTRLKLHYKLYAAKYGLTPVSTPGWRNARTRPANQPHRRVAMLAAILHGGYGRVMKRLADCTGMELDDARAALDVSVSPYWQTHYAPGVPVTGRRPPVRPGNASLDRLLINAVVPLAYAYGQRRGERRLAENAAALLERIPPERCHDTDLFAHSGYKATDALLTQGMIQLRRDHCDRLDCLHCRLGHRLLYRSIRDQETQDARCEG